MLGTKVAITQISLNAQDFSYVKLSTHGMTYSQNCFRRTIDAVIYWKSLHINEQDGNQ
jgi:hypothetical protein